MLIIFPSLPPSLSHTPYHTFPFFSLSPSLSPIPSHPFQCSLSIFIFLQSLSTSLSLPPSLYLSIPFSLSLYPFLLLSLFLTSLLFPYARGIFPEPYVNEALLIKQYNIKRSGHQQESNQNIFCTAPTNNGNKLAGGEKQARNTTVI